MATSSWLSAAMSVGMTRLALELLGFPRKELVCARFAAVLLRPGMGGYEEEAPEEAMVFHVDPTAEERRFDARSFLGAVEGCAFVAEEWVPCLQGGMLGVELMDQLGDCLDALTWRAQRE